MDNPTNERDELWRLWLICRPQSMRETIRALFNGVHSILSLQKFKGKQCEKRRIEAGSLKNKIHIYVVRVKRKYWREAAAVPFQEEWKI